MPHKEIRARGLEALDLATQLLHRYRLQSATGGIWEAADFHWNWRIPRVSDQTDQLFLVDESGPVAGVLLTSSGTDSWQVDPVSLPKIGLDTEDLWDRTQDEVARIEAASIEIPIRDDDDQMRQIAIDHDWQPSFQDRTAWLEAENKQSIVEVPSGFEVTDRSRMQGVPHHLSGRNGDSVEERLRQSSLYDAELDLVMMSNTGEVAGYALFWFDPDTTIGLVEPVRTEDAWQRRGIARSLVSHGVQKLIDRGASRIKVSNESEAAGKLYDKVGFKAESTTTWFKKPAF